ncbi:BadF/BadG/BcrA/BcrD ATPase family protein [Picrophilus oshimae]|uniref:N-acetylglucosamine kinase n=1 Tax=Picrophilus torridus (strain ATCC 700027 / DSM 9790 / JCM 10055 / NBRC 100828 / KAW 2/3) TaxID=1122961 RepID=A0A8G2FXM2_PICTO|nr:BadF/BadG/BcrA/BcrD ATPase family protein [Picrophilus oshimae]SMD31399.1 N-acetylglucosamine kinase [Picrophilus oshimae DSM 9789]
MRVISIDGGATKTLAVLYDTLKEEVLGIGVAGPSNFFSVSTETAMDNINKAMKMALSNINEYEIIMGLAGFGDSERANSIGLNISKSISHGHKFFIENDGVFAYRLANLFNDGAIFAPGTGSIGIYQKNGGIKRIGGWGWFAGDEGSASWIARRALTIAEEQYDKLIDGDSLVKLTEEYYKNEFRQAINNLEIEHPKRRVALMAPGVSKLAYSGDSIAVNIINEAADYDARILNVMSKFFDHEIPVALVGGTVLAGDMLKNGVIKNTILKNISFFYGYHVAVGGLILYMNKNNINFDYKLRDKIIKDIDDKINEIDHRILYENLGVDFI